MRLTGSVFLFGEIHYKWDMYAKTGWTEGGYTYMCASMFPSAASGLVKTPPTALPYSLFIRKSKSGAAVSHSGIIHLHADR